MDLAIAAVVFDVDQTVMQIYPPEGYVWKIRSMARDIEWFEQQFEFHDAFDIRKRYEAARVNDSLEVITLEKNCIVSNKDHDDAVEKEYQAVDHFIRKIRFLTECGIYYRDISFLGKIMPDDYYRTDIPTPDHIWKGRRKSFSSEEITLCNQYDISVLKFPENLQFAYGLYDLSYNIHYSIGIVEIMSALDMLFVKEEHSIKAILSNRVAALLGDNVRQYLELRFSVKNMYSLRSECVHSGDTSVGYEDVVKGREYLRRCLLKIHDNPSLADKKDRIALLKHKVIEYEKAISVDIDDGSGKVIRK